MRRFRRATVALAFVFLSVVAAAAPAGADVEQISARNGTLVARGVAVRVPVVVTCNDGLIRNVSVFLSQRLRSGVVTNGFGIVEAAGGAIIAPCTGAPQRFVVLVSGAAVGSNLAFKAGSALASPAVSFFDPEFGDVFVNAQQVIRLKNN